MIDLLIAVLLWLLVLISPMSHDAATDLMPVGCILEEDGSGYCAGLVLPPYDEVLP